MSSAAELDRFLEKMPEHVIVILDEAYYDYARTSLKFVGGITHARWST